MATAAFSSNSSTESSSTPTPESFKFETKYIVLSFLNELTKRKKKFNTSSPLKAFHTSSTDSDQKTRKYFNAWREKYSSFRRKQKSANVELRHRKKTEHETLRKTNSSISCGSKDISEKAQRVRKYSLPTSSSHSDHSLKSSASMPGMLNRSFSSGSCHECNSECFDADDELESSRGSSVVGSSLGVYSFRHREHVHHLSTVASESETEQDLCKTLNGTEPLSLDMISLEEKLYQIKSGQSNESAFLDDIDGVLPNYFDCIVGENNTDSDVSDLELEHSEDLCAKGGGEGDNVSVGIEVAALPNGSNGIVDRSCLHLDLTGDTAVSQQTALDLVVQSLHEEVQEQMISFESEVEDAIRSNTIQRIESPFECPLTPQSECARLLAVIGDDIDVQHRARIQSAVGLLFNSSSGLFTYDAFRNIASDVVDETLPGWRQVAILLMYTEGVTVRLVHSGHHNIARIIDFSVRLLTDMAADFIIRQGGWGAIMNSDPSQTCTTSQSSPENYQSTNPFIMALIEQQRNQDLVHRRREDEPSVHRQTTDVHSSRSEHIYPTYEVSGDVLPFSSYSTHNAVPVRSVADPVRSPSQEPPVDEGRTSSSPGEVIVGNPRSEFLTAIANGSSWILNRLLDTGQRFGITAQLSGSFILLAAGTTIAVAYFKSRSAQ